MNKKNNILITYGLWAIDAVSVLISFILATLIRFHNFRDMGDKTSYFLVCFVLVFLMTMYSFLISWNSGFMMRGYYVEFKKIVAMNIAIVIFSLAVMVFMKWADKFPRLVILYFIVINVILTYVLHLLFRKFMRIYYKSDLVKTKVLVIAQRDLMDEVLAKLNSTLDLSYQIIESIIAEDIITTPAAAAAPQPALQNAAASMSHPTTTATANAASPTSGNRMPQSIDKQFFENSMQMAVDEVFLYAPNLKQSVKNEIIYFFDDMGVICNYCMELPGMDMNRSAVGTFGDYSVLYYNHGQHSYKRLIVKRAIDIVGGMIGCILTIIMTPFVALAIKLDSKGPVFFKQTRIGRNGRRFTILKFRSMYIDAEERKKELEAQNEVKGLMFKMDNDPRITKVGKFIRKTSIDELPQFFNVVKGDMSLVGTRPPTEDEFEKYNQHYRRRLSMTPGLTGLWQVSGRSDIDDFDDVVKLDLEYIDNWSLGLDIKILFKTIAVVFVGRGSK